jgi:hypothetical protein
MEKTRGIKKNNGEKRKKEERSASFQIGNKLRFIC